MSLVRVNNVTRSTVGVVWGIIFFGWAAVLVGTGSSLASLTSWVVAVVAGVLAPGVAVVRAVRAGRAALIEDIGWGIPAGCLVAMVGWALGNVSPLGMPPWLLGPAVVVALLAVPTTRSRVLARPAPGWGIGANLALAAVLAVVIAWMTVDYLLHVPPYPQPGGSGHYPDALFQLSVVGQLRHSIALTYPLVAGEPYSYQWFAHAVLAHLVDAAPDSVDAVLRLMPTTLLPAVLVTGAVVAKEIAGRVVAGPVFAALMGVAGTTVATWQVDGFSVPIVQTYWWASLTTAFGWLAILATAGAALAIGHPRAAGSTPVALFVPFAVLAAGAKPSNLAVLLGGAGLAWVAALATRRPARQALLVAVVLGGMLLIARLTIYGGGDYGLKVDVFGGFQRRAAQLFPGLTGERPDSLALTLPEVSTVAVVAALVLYFLPLLPRLAGLFLLDRRDPRLWFFVGVAFAGLGAIAVFRHPGESEGFFLISGYPVLLVGSAWGLAVGWERWGRRTAAVVVGIVLGAITTVVVAALAPADPRAALAEEFGHPPAAAEMSSWRQAGHMLAPLGGLTVMIAVGALAGWWWARRDRDRRSAVAAACVAGLLGTGLLSTGLYVTAGAPTLAQAVVNDPNSVVTRDEADAARWLAAHSDPHDIYATNRVCVQLQQGPAMPEPCTAKTFAMSALSGRTAYITGWAYADRNLDSAWDATQWWSAQPFWAPPRLTTELDAFADPTLDRLAALYAAGVRWLVADSRGAPTDIEELDRIAIRRFSSEGEQVWELRNRPIFTRLPAGCRTTTDNTPTRAVCDDHTAPGAAQRRPRPTLRETSTSGPR